MPRVRTNDVVAILISDIHLSENPPRSRHDEPDWFDAMRRPLREVKAMAEELRVPVICAGDIFEKWNASAELINFAIDELPPMYAVPGNHDTPYHDPDQLYRSAYNTLRQAGTVRDVNDISVGERVGETKLSITGFGWGNEPQSLEDPEDDFIEIAVVHKYIWMPGKGYPGAPKEDKVTSIKDKLHGYDVALFGDNHTPFMAKAGKCLVYNHGSFLRRTVDDGPPTVGLLHEDRQITERILNCADKDRVDVTVESPEQADLTSIEEFIRTLHHSSDSKFDFAGEVERFIRKNKPSQAVALVLRHAIGKV